MKLAIFKGFEDDHVGYIEACKELNVEYEIIDILSDDYIFKVQESDADGFLCHPPCMIPEQKNIYDERLYFVNKVLGRSIYPSYEELFIYENKRNLSDLLKIINVEHPTTRVFCRKEDAMAYIEHAEYPLVFKSKIGASASGVDIVKNKRYARRLVNKSFGRIHPLLTLGHVRFMKLRGIPLPVFGMLQSQYVIIQDYHEIKWEWRIIKIGNFFSGHQKLLKGKFASGSNLVGWVNPPESLLRLVNEISIKRRYHSIAVDIFETKDGKFLVNEIQSMFGSYLHYQMKINDIPGVYKYETKMDQFIFKKGEYYSFGSKKIRVEHFIELLKE